MTEAPSTPSHQQGRRGAQCIILVFPGKLDERRRRGPPAVLGASHASGMAGPREYPSASLRAGGPAAAVRGRGGGAAAGHVALRAQAQDGEAAGAGGGAGGGQPRAQREGVSARERVRLMNCKNYLQRCFARVARELRPPRRRSWTERSADSSDTEAAIGRRCTGELRPTRACELPAFSTDGVHARSAFKSHYPPRSRAPRSHASPSAQCPVRCGRACEGVLLLQCRPAVALSSLM